MSRKKESVRSESPALRPCPFCGNPSPEIRLTGLELASVVCPGCDVEMAVGTDELHGLFEQAARQFVANRWNQRKEG